MEVIIKNDEYLFKFSGRMDTLESKKVSDIIFDKLKDKAIRQIEFDLKDVTYISSAFLNLVIETRKKYMNCIFTISNANCPNVKQVFELSGLPNLAGVFNFV